MDHSGGTPFWEIKGEKGKHNLDYDIIHHVSCGWNETMVNELHMNMIKQKQLERQKKYYGKFTYFIRFV